MAKASTISISYNFGEDYWAISDSSNEFEDIKHLGRSDVETYVKKMTRDLQGLGYTVTVEWPQPWPPDDEELWAEVDSA